MLKGKVAVVTGGTRGIGYAIVKKYLENGAKVVLFGSRDETVNKALAALKFLDMHRICLIQRHWRKQLLRLRSNMEELTFL